jgi:KTSC domain
MVERQPVKSSTIKSVGYDPKSKTLEVEFNGGSVYHYHDVPKETHEGLVSAKSAGSYLHASVKGVYKHSKQ